MAKIKINAKNQVRRYQSTITFTLPQFDAREFKGRLKIKYLPRPFVMHGKTLMARITTLADLDKVNKQVTHYLSLSNPNINDLRPARLTINWRYKTLKFH